MKKTLQVSVSQFSDKGCKQINQDFHDFRIPDNHQLFSKGVAIAIADGISSSAVSQEASQLAISTFLEDYYATPEVWSVQKSSKSIIKAINSWLYSKSRQSEHRYDLNKGYLCTFSAMVVKSNTAHIFHVGDVRIYRLRNKVLEQLTTDHRVQVSAEKSYLSRALGMDSEVLIDYEKLVLEEGDTFYFMTDGVHEFIEQNHFSSFVEEGDFSDSAQRFVTTALGNGSDDNLTAQVVRIDSLPSKNAAEFSQALDEKQPAPLLEENDMLDEYKVIRQLSSNHRSHVYLAKDTLRNIEVVLKVPSLDLREDKSYLERFMMEEWIARRLDNNHLMKASPQPNSRTYLYTVFEYIEAQTLAQWMRDNFNPTLEVVRGITEQIAKGLQAFHRHEMIHQDIRPENILIDSNGTIKIIDYGSARVEGIEEMRLEDEENILGTLQYSAPEYFLGEMGTNRSDVYSLAVIVYNMLSGELPYGVEVAKATTKASQKKLKYKSLYTDEYDIPFWLDQTLQKALHPNPFYRYEELSEFIYDLRHPNQKFLVKSQPPIFERKPVVFWKSVSVILVCIIGYLLYLLSK